MNFVFFSPNCPAYYSNFCDRLKRLGINVLGIGDAPYEQLDYNLKNALTEYYRVANLANYDEVLRACGYFTHKYGHIDHLDSQNEYWLESDARLRTDFNIVGTKFPEVMEFKRKSLMKTYFKKAMVPSARFSMVTDKQAAKEFIKEVGYPVIVKPDIGVGANSTYDLRNDHDLDLFFEKPLSFQYIMEEFIEGYVVTYDGIADEDKNILFSASHLFTHSIMDIVNTDDHLSFYSLRQIDKDVEEAGRRSVKAFDTRAKFFHFEFFRMIEDKAGLGKKGDLFALEVNMRPPGSYMLDMMNYASDVDVYQIWADMIKHTSSKMMIERRYHCGYASRKNYKRYIHSHEEIVQRYGGELVFQTSIEAIFSLAMGNYAYIFRSPAVDKIKEIVTYIQAEHS